MIMFIISISDKGRCRVDEDSENSNQCPKFYIMRICLKTPVRSNFVLIFNFHRILFSEQTPSAIALV